MHKPCHGTAWAILFALMANVGCISGRYQPSGLPMAFHAPPVENVHTLDLSRFSRGSASTDSIAEGDLLQVVISAGLGSGESETIPVRVLDNGIASIDLLGELNLAGLTLEESEKLIVQSCTDQGLYRNPSVSVTITRPKIHRITVIGAVKKEGEYRLPRGGSDLLSALVAAGGLAADAGPNVEIRNPESRNNVANSARRRTKGSTIARTGHSQIAVVDSPVPPEGPRSSTINLISAVQSSDPGPDLMDGTVIRIERKPAQPIQVIGLVNKQDRYEIPRGQEYRVLDAIAAAKGVSSKVADKVLISRPIEGSPVPATIEVSLKEAQVDSNANLRLMPGDTVSVEQTPATVAIDVINFIRFGVTAPLTALF